MYIYINMYIYKYVRSRRVWIVLSNIVTLSSTEGVARYAKSCTQGIKSGKTQYLPEAPASPKPVLLT